MDFIFYATYVEEVCDLLEYQLSPKLNLSENGPKVYIKLLNTAPHVRSHSQNKVHNNNHNGEQTEIEDLNPLLLEPELRYHVRSLKLELLENGQTMNTKLCNKMIACDGA